MKKAIKGLIIAASVAAVVGVGAVSYAAWSGGTKQSKEIGGTTGSINTIGSLTVTPKAGTFTTADSAVTMNALFPVDQTADKGLPTGGLTYWEFTVAVTGDGAQVVTVKGEITQATDGDAVLYYATSAPSGGAVTGAKDISSAQTIDMTALTDGKVYVYMTSDKTEAMNATIKLTFEATAAAAS